MYVCVLAAGNDKVYDWATSQNFFLSVNEAGDLLAFLSQSETAELKLYHDPQLGSTSNINILAIHPHAVADFTLPCCCCL